MVVSAETLSLGATIEKALKRRSQLIEATGDAATLPQWMSAVAAMCLPTARRLDDVARDDRSRRSARSQLHDRNRAAHQGSALPVAGIRWEDAVGEHPQ